MKSEKVKLPLKPDELRAAREGWALSVTDLAHQPDVDRRTVGRWEAGTIAIPKAIQLLIRLMQTPDGWVAVDRLMKGYSITIEN